MARGPVLIAVGAIAVLATATTLFLRDGASTSVATDGDSRSRVVALEREIAELRAEIERLRSEAKPAVVAERTVDPAAERAADVALDESSKEQKPSDDAKEVFLPFGAARWLAEKFPELHGELTAEEAVFLKKLELGGAELTDDELRFVAELRRLAELDLNGTAITNAALSHLSRLPNLRHVDLSGTSITASGIDWLPADSMRSIHLSGSSLTDQDVGSFQRLAHLEQVKLNRTGVTDQGMDALGGCRSLRHVELDGTSVTLAGLRALLLRNPDLHRIEARDTRVTEEDAARLLEEFPGKEIVVTQGGLPITLAGRF